MLVTAGHLILLHSAVLYAANGKEDI